MASSPLDLRDDAIHPDRDGPAGAATASGWLIDPWCDALLVANVAWPLLLLLQVGEGFSGREGLQFWQIYFLTTPHRWITLALVFLDRERFGQRRFTFLTIAIAVIAVCLGVRLTTGTLTCLLTIDYLWNAWHFAAQHHGIYRIYARRSPSQLIGSEAIERWSMRLLLLYVIVRVAGATWSYQELEQALQLLDWVAVAAAAGLLLRDFLQTQPSWPRSIYLVSMLALYVSLLMAVHFNQPGLVLSLAAASAIFHATEYLTLVTWSAHSRDAALPGRLGLMSYLAPRWGLALAIFILVLGASGWLLQQHLLQPWLLLNVIVAFLHYAYDGLIWRRGSGDKPPVKLLAA
jgi:hypothetical protein